MNKQEIKLWCAAYVASIPREPDPMKRRTIACDAVIDLRAALRDMPDEKTAADEANERIAAAAAEGARGRLEPAGYEATNEEQKTRGDALARAEHGSGAV